MPQSRKKKDGAGHGGEEVRLQTYLAKAGIASRRASEALIAEGRVFVNGHSVTAPGTKVRPGVDRVEVNGQPVEEQPVTWVAIHKPRGYVTSRIDQYGRKTVYDLLPERFHGLFHVGRLDRDSEGILLLTNDGNTANRMLHPSYGMTKEYLADVEGRPASEVLNRLVEGVEVDGETMRAESAKRLHQVDVDVFRIQLVLQEGKKREVRRMLESVGHSVVRLIRRRFGPIELGELPSGKWRVVSPAELSHVASGTVRPRKTRPADAESADEAPRAERPSPRKAENARPAKSGASRFGKPGMGPARGPRSESSRPARPGTKRASSRAEDSESPRPPRGESSRPARPRADRPTRSESDRPSRPSRPGSDRPARSESDRPSRPSRPGTDRPARSESDRPSRPPRSGSDRPTRSESDRPSRPPRSGSERPSRSGADRPARDDARPPRSDSRSRSDSDRPSRSDSPRSSRSESDRPARSGAPRAEWPATGRPTRSDSARPKSGSPRASRSDSDRPARSDSPRPSKGGPSRGPKSGGGKSGGGKPGGGKPGGGKPKRPGRGE